MSYKLKPSDGGPVDKDDAQKWMSNYSKKYPAEVKGYFFGRDILLKILCQSEAVGLRIYFAVGDEEKMQVVLVGSREDGSNIWPDGAGKDGGGGVAADTGVPCPPYCAP